MQITLAARHHGFITSLLPDKGRADIVRYLAQLSAIDIVADDQEITVDVAPDVILHVYTVLGNVSERFSARLNNEIKVALIPQLNDAGLLGQIQSITDENEGLINELVQRGYDYLTAIKF